MLAILLSTVLLPGRQAPDGAAIYRAMCDRLKAATTLRIEVEAAGVYNGAPFWLKVSAAFARPGLWHETLTASVKGAALERASNGLSDVSLYPEANQYDLTRPFPEFGQAWIVFKGVEGFTGSKVATFNLLHSERAEFDGRSCVKLDFKVASKTGQVLQGQVQEPYSLFVDETTHLPLGYAEPYQQSKAVYKTFALDAPVGPDQLKLTLPDSATRKIRPREEANLVKNGSRAPALVAVTPEGRSVSLVGQLKTKKAVVVCFWFIDCPSCHEDFPYLDGFMKEMAPKGVGVMCVDSVDPLHDCTHHIKKELATRYQLPFSGDGGKWAAKAFGTAVYPTYFIVAADGTVVAHSIGFDERAFRKALGSIGIQ